MDYLRGFGKPSICNSKAKTLVEYTNERREFIKSMRKNPSSDDPLMILSIYRMIRDSAGEAEDIILSEMLTVPNESTIIRTRPFVNGKAIIEYASEEKVTAYQMAIKVCRNHSAKKKTKIKLIISGDRDIAAGVHSSFSSLSRVIMFSEREVRSFVAASKHRGILKDED